MFVPYNILIPNPYLVLKFDPTNGCDEIRKLMEFNGMIFSQHMHK